MNSNKLWTLKKVGQQGTDTIEKGSIYFNLIPS